MLLRIFVAQNLAASNSTDSTLDACANEGGNEVREVPEKDWCEKSHYYSAIEVQPTSVKS